MNSNNNELLARDTIFQFIAANITFIPHLTLNRSNNTIIIKYYNRIIIDILVKDVELRLYHPYFTEDQLYGQHMFYFHDPNMLHELKQHITHILRSYISNYNHDRSNSRMDNR